MGNVVGINGTEFSVDFDERMMDIARQYVELFIDMGEAKYPDKAPTDDQFMDVYLDVTRMFTKYLSNAFDELKEED